MREFCALRVKFTRPEKSAMPELHEMAGKPHWHWPCSMLSVTLRISPKTNSGLTLVELLLVVVVLVVLFVMLIPSPRYGKHAALSVYCKENLKQTGLAYRIWADDNGGKYPMELSKMNGGTLELMGTADAWQTYQVMSNELSTPKVLFCPADEERQMYATNFSTDLQGKISYFIGLDAGTNRPQSFLSGDDNFEIAGQPVKSGLLSLWTNDPVSWAATRHMHSGNLGLGDGSVQCSTSSGLRSYLVQTEIATNRLAIP